MGKTIGLILKAAMILALSGCTANQKLNREIEYKELLNQKEHYYLVLFYMDTCLACRDIKMIINFNEQNGFQIPLYYVDFNKLTDIATIKTGANSYTITRVPLMIEIFEWQITNYYLGFDEIRIFIQNHNLIK